MSAIFFFGKPSAENHPETAYQAVFKRLAETYPRVSHGEMLTMAIAPVLQALQSSGSEYGLTAEIPI